MPLTQVMSVRDTKSDTFGRPFFAPSLGAAIRSFADFVNSKEDSDIVRHPEDFNLYHLGTFDDETGKFTELEVPKQVSIGIDCRNAYLNKMNGQPA